MTKLPALAFDHKLIIRTAFEHLLQHSETTTAGESGLAHVSQCICWVYCLLSTLAACVLLCCLASSSACASSMLQHASWQTGCRHCDLLSKGLYMTVCVCEFYSFMRVNLKYLSVTCCLHVTILPIHVSELSRLCVCWFVLSSDASLLQSYCICTHSSTVKLML